MRIALARALFIKPHLLLLDEPTNHLDLEACVWLEEELKNYKQILVIISHSQDFMNGVCTQVMHLDKQKLNYFGGNYDAFVRTRLELLENQAKRYQWEQDQIAHMKNYIARFGHGSAKLARQAQSKEKTLAKMVAGGLTEKVKSDKILSFYFYSCGEIPPPVIMVQVMFKTDENIKLRQTALCARFCFQIWIQFLTFARSKIQISLFVNFHNFQGNSTYYDLNIFRYRM